MKLQVIGKIYNKIIYYELYSFLEMIFSLIPGTIGIKIRFYFYKLFLRGIGKGVVISTGCKFQSPQNIIIGNNCHINHGVFIAANKDINGKVELRNNVLIGPYTVIHSGNHKYDKMSIPVVQQGFKFASILIKDDVWIASHCVVLSGVQLESKTIYAAGAIITKNTENGYIYGGVPAKKIKKRTS